ncbi:pseudouridine-5'-phosphate glycosidase [Phycicoccus endophyticus]|uniref:Pseudouridine-5'-phosphate glycosidase n=1 Tax=Phycicoccus endophyticus TaxID=1690220 RepID=A0A7G9R2G9_9MICO|nr:pseudouridine-5'-phosphate glycosidase [Phycicoccus endophyticus]NHI20822.1 pseudouridine-5'-phosphate glycosidase [Phycicoccus endophyticus]QNN49794.1 pseudouridine-5'-phosphate glycosidase [Phycicoccus endophyticus]GGL35198.1 pseudouridine-5'-phosphate glycosidase [Phycicoccus endophyticus]
MTTPEPHPLLALAPEVRDALAEGLPVVALESTIISHGMPYPQNVAMARRVEAIVRAGGAVPATIAVIAGRPTVGLADDELELLGSDGQIPKVSVRDLGYVVSTGSHGATTVASTMRIAGLAGIELFVTGGLGGVHQGAESSMDVSADLTELSRTRVAVVSAGVKSILDIGRTLEVLETLGVPVVGLGTDDFPSFFSRSSGVPVPMRLERPEEVARMARATWDLGLPSGIAVANPVPVEDELPREEIDEVIARALADADRAGVRGKDITPYLLGRVVELSGGRSLATNIALVEHNARVGAAIAVALAALG